MDVDISIPNCVSDQYPQRVSGLSDKQGRILQDLRISVTDRCNFRCRYCMPAEVFGAGYQFLPHAEILNFEEIEKIARIFVAGGVTKLRLTGGEPLLRRDLPKLVGKLAAIPGVEDLAMTTNGVLLPKHAADLKSAGLDRVTVSLDALDPDVFGAMNGVGAKPAKVLAGIEAAKEAGLGVKINAVIQKGVNQQEILPLARKARELGAPLRFIEYMDVGNENGWDLSQVFGADQILEVLRSEFDLTPADDQEFTETALRYNCADGGEIGLIASVTKPFCRGCGRIRLSATGELFTCLFAAKGFDLKSLVRRDLPDKELSEQISALWSNRDDRYSEERGKVTSDRKVEMSYIGG